MTADVFISYRGADRALARKLEQRLRSRWGSRVFRDETGLAPGASWSEQLTTRLRDAAVVIALVGPGWSVNTDPVQEDWVRAELLAAVNSGTPILPVLVGDPDVLREKLRPLPEAFRRQAIVVSEGIPLSGVQDIVLALRQLGAFEGAEPSGLAAGRADLVSDQAHAECLDALAQGRSVFVEGGGGSGRTALLRRLMAERRADTGGPRRFVAACGIDNTDAVRSTHTVMGGWFASLCRSIEHLPLMRDRLNYGHRLVDAVLSCGPDLLSRRVVPVSLLLALGDDGHDHQVLLAARRPTERWAPYPPRRLVIQARNVLERFVESAEAGLDLVVADVDAADASSRDLIADLLRTNAPIQLVFAAAPSPEDDVESITRLLPAVRYRRPADVVERVTRVKLDDRKMWGSSGSPLPKWLLAHHIRLDDELLGQLDEPNPYYALSRLWYLTDRGFVAEEIVVDGEVDEGGLTRWKLTTTADVPQPTHDALLRHLLDEYVPADLQPLVEVGALVGRTFPFDAVHQAAHAGEPATATARDAAWERLQRSDPDNMVLSCTELRFGERYVTFALDDLVPHITGRIAARRRAELHARLAEAFATQEAAADPNDFETAFRAVALAAEHWEQAGGPSLRTAADAHRRAAQFAEKALAYREAEHHYRVGIRLLSQLIADTSDFSHDHEDLLIVANCQYRLGQMVRLSAQFTDDGDGSPLQHFANALGNLNALRARLRNHEFTDAVGMAPTVFARDDIPGPDRIQHLLRVCDGLSGYVMLDQATWLNEQGRRDEARDALFETLRCAELAAGEADTRWLLAAASARLADSLANQAIALSDDHVGGQRARDAAHDLAVEALFYIERVVGLRATTTAEESDLAEPKALARDVFGRLVTQIHGKPRLAEWVYRKLNKHSKDIRVAEDMSTDFRLGQFLLTLVTAEPLVSEGRPGVRWRSHPIVDEAGFLLGRYANWARESGLREALGPALNRLAVTEIVCEGGYRSEAACRSLRAALDEPHPGSQIDSLLLLGLAYTLPTAPSTDGGTTDGGTTDGGTTDGGTMAPADAPVADAAPVDAPAAADETVEAFRQAIELITGSDRSADAVDQVLTEGWRQLSLRLLALCPALGLIGLELAGVQIGDALNHPGDPVHPLRRRAEAHIDRVRHDPPISPVHDHAIEQLAEVRLSRRAAQQKRRALTTAEKLLTAHAEACVAGESADRDVLWRDLRWATYVYDWYDDVEPARLLVLAAEWHQAVNGSQWASPQFLRGPLAIVVLRNQFDAEIELGTERYRRIARLVEHRAVGASDASPLEMVFFLAIELTERQSGTHGVPPDHWTLTANEPGRLEEAYQQARTERLADLVAFGRPVEASAGAAPDSHVVFDDPELSGSDGVLAPTAAGA